MIHRPSAGNSFEFVRVAALRAAQLMNGCVANVAERRRPVLTAQLEVALGKIKALPRADSEAGILPVPTLDPVARVRR